MQNAPPRLPSRGPASIQRSSRARSTSPPSCGAVRAERRADDRRRRRPTTIADGRHRQRRDQVPPRQRRRRGRAARPWPASSAGSRGARRSTAACIASNVGRLTALANSEASSGDVPPRRRLTSLASPLIAFIAAAHGHGDLSARPPARRRRRPAGQPGRRAVARPRTAGIGSRSTCPSGNVHVGRQLRRDVALQPGPRRRAGRWPARRRGPPRPRSSGESARSARRSSGPAVLARPRR